MKATSSVFVVRESEDQWGPDQLSICCTKSCVLLKNPKTERPPLNSELLHTVNGNTGGHTGRGE